MVALLSLTPDAIFASMPETHKIIHEILPVGMLQCNCHIIGDPKTHEALVIDPGDDAVPRPVVVVGRIDGWARRERSTAAPSG